MKSLNYDPFSGEDLLTVVGRSWLLPWEYMEWIAVERFRKYRGRGRTTSEI